MPTMFLLLYRSSIIWWTMALLAPVEPIFDLIDNELVRRRVA